MFISKIKITLMGIFWISWGMHAELLIVKRDDFGYAPLSQAESLKYNDQISEILQKYQWPMCLGSHLTDEEKNELLSADVQHAEELFIQKKLQQAMPELYLNVIFIPTSLYELFCLLEMCNGDTQSIQDVSIGNTLYFNPLLRRHDLSVQQVRTHIQNAFKEINNLFFEKQKPAWINFSKGAPDIKASKSLLMNNAMIHFLNYVLPEMNFCKNEKEISDLIAKNSSKLRLALLKKLESNNYSYCFSYQQCLLKSEKNISFNQIIDHVVALEYEARKLNKALLLRGSGLMELNLSIQQQPVHKSLAGTTIYKETDWNYDFSVIEEVPFWKKYKEKNNVPYSISFGTSLFAGIINDPGACAYVFLSNCQAGMDYFNKKNTIPVGYGLLINKKDYVEHQNGNLFYIPSLAVLPSLIARGEWFHARAKAAIHQSKRGHIYVKGVLHAPFWDPTGFIVVTRDPLKHAELFSNFLVQHGRLIQPGDSSFLTDAEKAFANDVMKAQSEAANLYKAVRTITPKVEKATKKFKETRDKKFFDWMHDFENM